MNKKIVIFTTAGSLDEAYKIARGLVGRRLAACVNIVPKIVSIYRWEGKVEEAEEWLVMIKTTESASARLCEAIRELHSYEVPECICIPVEGGSAAYLKWIEESVE